MFRNLKVVFTLLFLLALFNGLAQTNPVKIALIKYNGGGDWYADPTALPNLIAYCNEQLKTDINPEPATVEVGSIDIFNYPFVHITGHGNVIFSENDVANLRTYLESGGFLHIDDNYGLDKYIRREMKKVFPELDFVELPYSHPIFHQKFDFEFGVPKIHEHDSKPAQGFGLVWNDRLVCFYSYESDISDGWEDPAVHSDPWEKREKALQMGANLISFVFNQ